MILCNMSRKKLLILIIFITIIIGIVAILMNFSIKFEKLQIDQTHWEAIISKRNENDNARIEKIEFNGYSLIIDEEEDKIYYSLINESSNKYNPDVDFETLSEGYSLAILEDPITDAKIKENHEFKLMIYNNEYYHVYSLICTDLPMLNITFDKIVQRPKVEGNELFDERSSQMRTNSEVQGDETSVKKGKKSPIMMWMFNNQSNNTNRVTISKGTIKKSKDSNSYTLNLEYLTLGNNIRENEISLLNMEPSSKYDLNPVDNEVLNEESEESEENKEVQNVVNLFVNNRYKGLYTIEVAK